MTYKPFSMHIISIVLVLFLFFACNFTQPKGKDSHPQEKHYVTIDTTVIAGIKLASTADYHRILDTIDAGDLLSLDIAGILFRNCTADTLTHDSLFVLLRDFYNHLAEVYLENNEKISSQLVNSPSILTVSTLKTTFAAHGLLLGSSEGTYFLEPQISFLFQKYGSAVSTAYREYLTIESREQKERFIGEGKILITPDSLMSRIITWDHFIGKYPDFVSLRFAQDKYAQYLGAFLTGIEGSKIFDPETTLLSDSSRICFELFIVKNPDSRTTEVVKSYLDLLKSTDFRYTEKVDSFLLEKVFGAEIAGEQK